MKPKHISEEAWAKAQDLLKTAPAKWNGGTYRDNVCAGAYIEKNGKLASATLEGYVCHAFIEREYNGRHLFFNTIKNTYADPEAFQALCRWMKDKSPVRRFILNETYESMYHGGIIVDCTRCPSNVLLWICKVFRAAYEDTWRIPIWHKLVEKGVHPMVALCYSQCVNSKWADNRGTTHCSVFVPPMTKDEMKKLFIDHLPQKPKVKKAAPAPAEEYVEDDDWENDDYDGPAWDTAAVFSSGDRYGWGDKHLFYLPKAGKKEKVPDGWGGFVEKAVPLDAKSVAKELKKLEKEYNK
jgi:hypothetical protein